MEITVNTQALHYGPFQRKNERGEIETMEFPGVSKKYHVEFPGVN